LNALEPNPVTCVVPKPIACVLQRKQIFISRLHPELSSLDEIQVDDLKVEKFKCSYARNMSSFKIGIPVL